MNDLPKSLPDTLEELYTLMAACIEAGYSIASDHVCIVEAGGSTEAPWPVIYWQGAEDRLREVLAPYNNLTRPKTEAYQ